MPTAKEPGQGNKNVVLVGASEFHEGSMSVSANGQVEAFSQADLKSQVSAPVALINVSIGDQVYAGKVIMELENSDLRAQLAQAQAVLARAEGEATTGSVSLESAKQSAVEKARDAYFKSYDAVMNSLDPILYNNDGRGGRLAPYVADNKLNSAITDADLDLKAIYPSWKNKVDTISANSSSEDIKAVLDFSTVQLNKTDRLLSNVSVALNDAARYATDPFLSMVAGWKATVSAARGNVSGALAALTSAANVLSTSGTSQGLTLKAGVESARAGVNNIQAQLAKTVIRSPIAGQISSLPLREGELATPGTLLATVIGDDSRLLVKAYVSGSDLARVTVGASALVDGDVPGKVENIAPSVDPISKKAEVDIAVSDEASKALVIGDNVEVSIKAGNTAITSGKYFLPIQDVKIMPDKAYVLTLDSENRVVRNPVTLGAVKGDFVEVISGINDSMKLVTPVYELDEGQKVDVR